MKLHPSSFILHPSFQMSDKNYTGSYLVIIVALLLVIVIFILGNQSFKATEQAAFDEFNRRQLALTTAAIHGIELYFETLAGSLRAVGQIEEIQQLDELSTRWELQHKFDELQALGVNDIAVLDTNGVVRYSAMSPQLEGVDFSWRKYYQEAKESRSNDIYIIEFIEFQGVDAGQKGVLVAVPMFGTAVNENAATPSGEFVGIVIATLKLDAVIQQFMSPLNSSERGHALLIDDQFTLLWSPDAALFGKNLMQEGREFPSFQQVMVRMVAGATGMAEYTHRQFDESTGQYTDDEEEKLIAYAPIHLGSELWSLGVWAPKEDARQLIRSIHFRQLTLVSLSFLIIIVSATYILATSFRTSKFLEQEVEAKTSELKDAHQRLLTVLESLDAIVYVADMETDEILFANEYTRDVWGDVVGKAGWQVLQTGQTGPTDFYHNKNLLTAAGEPGQIYAWETQNLVVGRWYEVRDRAIWWVDGRLARLEIAIDITERKRAEGELVQLRKAVQTSGEVIFLTDREGLITYINPEFTRLYGYTAAAVVGQTTPRILKSGRTPAPDYKTFWQMLLNGQIVKGEITNRCQDGRLVIIGSSASPIVDEHDHIVGFLAIQRDITERKAAEEKINQRHKELAALNAIATTVSQSLDLNQILNDALEEVLRLDMLKDEAKGMIFLLNQQTGTLEPAVHRGTPKDHPCLIKPPQVGECLCGFAARHGQVIISDDTDEDERHTRPWPGGERRHQDICLPMKVRGNVLGVMNVRLPVTQKIGASDVRLLTAVTDQISLAIENARLFEAVNQQRQKLHVLSARLVAAEEAERRRLARELHDRVGQNLTALGINLNIIRTLLPENADNGASSRIEESLALVEQTTERIRDVMSDLRPPMLDDYGLVATLRWYGTQLSSRTGLSVTVQGQDTTPPLAAPVENALFRIAQEALTNVAKHAKATEVVVSVEVEDETTRLVVADNGQGFNPVHVATPSEDHGWGLLIMAERAEAINGRCWVESHPDAEGTRVIVEVKR